MKKIAVFILVMLPLFLIAQSGLKPHDCWLYLSVIDYSEEEIPFFEIFLRTEEGQAIKSSITDSHGNCNFKVITGKTYKVFIYDTMYISTINIPLHTMSYYSQKVTIPELTPAQVIERTTIDTIDQYRISVPRPNPGNIFFKVVLKDHMNRTVKNTDVRLFNSKTKTVYLNRTNNYGQASFHVPGKSTYEVGVNKFELFQSVTVPHHSFGLTLTYIPTKVREYEENDTITQDYDAYMRSTTDRALFKVHLINHDNKPLPNEEVYVDMLGTTKVYAGKTGRDGVLTMLLPKGNQYELNFKYERAMKRLDYPMSPTLYTNQFYMTYIGSEKVEQYYENATRKGEFRVEFMEPKINPITIEQNLFEKTNRGYNYNFPSQGVILTPAVSDDNLIVSTGYYSSNIYCINATTGTPKWAISLAESGPSVIVISDGMILINTQSCTLYAIEIETGLLAWSKWLGPNIYHSPAVINGKVIAAYPNELSFTTDNFVLAAFDLKTGEIVWQNKLKNEPFSAPVCADTMIYITDRRGYLYNYSLATGTQKAVARIMATCAPVYDGKSLLVNIVTSKNTNMSTLTSFNPLSLKQKQIFDGINDSSTFANNWGWEAATLMSHSRNRVLYSKNYFYQINRKGLQSITTDGKINWTYPLPTNVEFNPIIADAGKYLLTSENNSRLVLVDFTNGKKIQQYSIPDILYSEPVVFNGWIYCGTKNGKLVAINTKNKSITGWPQWGMNANHNPVKN